MQAFRWLAAAATIISPVWGQSTACDLNSDGAVNVADVQLAINMSIGRAACAANVYGAGVCNVVAVQRVTNAALGGTCVTGTTSRAHSVTLNWTASTSVNVVGYNVYRALTAGGAYTKVNSSVIAGVSFIDTAVLAGQTYYYVATAVDSNNNESSYSPETIAIVPSP